MEKPISFTLSDEGASFAKTLANTENLPDEISHILSSAKDAKSIDLPELIKVFEWRCERYKVKNREDPVPSVYPLIKMTSMSTPKLPKREQDPELKERLKKLAANQQHREYNKMVTNVSRKEPVIKKSGRTRAPLISGLNFALTLFASCGATMYLLRNFVPDLALRAGIGLVVGTIILVIEIYLAVREIEKQTVVDKNK